MHTGEVIGLRKLARHQCSGRLQAGYWTYYVAHAHIYTCERGIAAVTKEHDRFQ